MGNMKHANGLLYFHSKKPEFLKQEIYANLILYNFGIFLANEAAEENRKKKRNSNNKYNYEIDFSSAEYSRTAREYSAIQTESRFPQERNFDFHMPVRRCISVRIIQIFLSCLFVPCSFLFYIIYYF